MAQLSDLAPRIIRHALARYGHPRMTVVRPLASWNLPAGFNYDRTLDVIRNGAGTVLPNPEAYWTTDVVYFVPTRASKLNDAAQLEALIAAGIASVGTVDVWIAGTDIPTILASHSIKIGQRWYTLRNLQQAPAASPDAVGLWARATLQGRS